MDRNCGSIVGIAVAVALVVSVGAVPASAQQSDPVFEVALHEDGSATVTIVYTFDLTTDTEKQAFEQLRNEADARERFVTSFEQRMRTFVSETENATGREMSVGDASVAFSTSDRTGIAALTIVWNGLAANEGDRLVVSEPFASGFNPDRTFRIVAPEGYELTSVSPPADTRGSRRAIWQAGTSLDGFKVVAAPAATETTAPSTATPTDGEGETTPTDGPGFGFVVALIAVLAAALLVGRGRTG